MISSSAAGAAIRAALHLLCWLPAAWLFYLAATNGLGANPAEALLRSLGDWALRFLCVALAITPLRQWLHWLQLAAYRRMLGLYTFFYASLHWLAYVVFDMGLDWAGIVADLPKRPFILVGTVAWLVLLVLAVTSIPALVRRLGGKRWQKLHRVNTPVNNSCCNAASQHSAILRNALSEAVATSIPTSSSKKAPALDGAGAVSLTDSVRKIRPTARSPA